NLKQDLKDEFEFIFGTNKDFFNPMDEKKTFSVMNERGYYINQEPTPEQKKIFIETICGREYDETALIHLSVRIKRDFYTGGFNYDGWALTMDAFFVGGRFVFNGDRLDKVLYKDIKEVWTDFTIVTKDSKCISVEVLNGFQIYVGLGKNGFFPLDRRTMSKLGRFLNFAKNLT
ncbi:MAG: hypothetical protein IKI76_05690, partial [Selenomonadaceae bacterium]|nr:hypothetical protein [Selenomonadaceae bacterium]